jgi:hypothetical protein
MGIHTSRAIVSNSTPSAMVIPTLVGRRPKKALVGPKACKRERKREKSSQRVGDRLLKKDVERKIPRDSLQNLTSVRAYNSSLSRTSCSELSAFHKYKQCFTLVDVPRPMSRGGQKQQQSSWSTSDEIDDIMDSILCRKSFPHHETRDEIKDEIFEDDD